MLRKKRIFDVAICLIASFLLVSICEASSAAGAFRSTSGDGSETQHERLSTSAVSLGAYSADGGSPGHIVARTYRDAQSWYGVSRRIEWRGGPQVHFAWVQQDIPGPDPTVAARYLMYNAFDPTDVPNGEFAVRDGQPLNSTPFTYTTGNPNADVDETGHMIIAGHSGDPRDGALSRSVETFWDISGAGTYGTFVGDTIPKSLARDPAGSQCFPKIEYQEYNGQFITHLLVSEFVSPSCLTYWRRAGGNMTLQGWTTQFITDSATYSEGSIATSREFPGGIGGKVAICWTQAIDPAHATVGDDWGSNIAFVESEDAGLTWSTPQKIINFDPGQDMQVGWIESCALYDSEGYLHIAFNSPLYLACTGTAGKVDMSRIMHWSNRVAGPNAGGLLSTITVADMGGLTSMCGRGDWNVLSAAKPMISECNGRLYAIWQQFGDYYSGDTTDCASGDLISHVGSYNSDIFMSVSLTLNGSLWDAARNLTNSETPDCDTTVGNECDHDTYPTMSRYGMNTSDFGSIVWNAVKPEVLAVRDKLDAGFPDDGYYLDVFYVNDLFPGNAGWGGNSVWTYNPLKWFRLPCVPPVIEPRIVIGQSDYLLPSDWVKGGQAMSFDVTVENIGNDVLNISSIDRDLDLNTPAGAVTVVPTAMTIPAGGSDVVTVTLNPGGFIDPAGETQVPIVADIKFNSNDPTRPEASLEVNTIVADTVAQEEWEILKNGSGMALAVSSSGDAGHYGIGSQNLDFVSAGIDCDPTADVYLSSLGTAIIPSDSSLLTVAAVIVISYFVHETLDYLIGPSYRERFLEPIKEWIKKTWDEYYPKAKRWLLDLKDKLLRLYGSLPDTPPSPQTYFSGVVAAPGSGVGFAKQWIAPQTDGTFFIERIMVFSVDGGLHGNFRIGELIDWDVPSDVGKANEGGISLNPGSVDYLWMRGLETNPGEDCLDNDHRYGASGFLGYYWASDYAADNSVNHTGLYGGHILRPVSLFDASSGFIQEDSLQWYINQQSLTVDDTLQADQIMTLSFGSFYIPPADTLNIWIAHASIYNGDLGDVHDAMLEAMGWYLEHRDEVQDTVCCGRYCGGFTGNIDCDTLCRINLNDIIRLIDRTYLSKRPLCCEANANVDGDAQGRITLADITRLIDHVYLSKGPTAPCQ